MNLNNSFLDLNALMARIHEEDPALLNSIPVTQANLFRLTDIILKSIPDGPNPIHVASDGHKARAILVPVAYAEVKPFTQADIDAVTLRRGIVEEKFFTNYEPE